MWGIYAKGASLMYYEVFFSFYALLVSQRQYTDNLAIILPYYEYIYEWVKVSAFYRIILAVHYVFCGATVSYNMRIDRDKQYNAIG